MGDGATTVGTYFNEDEQDGLLDEFDETFDDRSAAIKDAMRLSLACEKAIDAIGYDFDSERDRRMFVRQAILDQLRREQSSDSSA